MSSYRVDVYKTTLAAVKAKGLSAAKVNGGGRVLLPPSCLNDISQLSMVFPLQFKIETRSRRPRFVYAAVLEFTAELGTVVLPQWMLDHLGLAENSAVTLTTCSLSGANIVKLQPHTKDFIALSDPRMVLEHHLTHYPVLTKGTSIVINHAQREFKLNIVSVTNQANDEVEAVLSARADTQAMELKVDFERPLDMPEEEPVPQSAMQDFMAQQQSGSEEVHFSAPQFSPPSINEENRETTQQSTAAPSQPSFTAFTGDGLRMSCNTTSNASPSSLSQQEIRAARLKAMAKR